MLRCRDVVVLLGMVWGMLRFARVLLAMLGMLG